jgi:uncharacterized protein HemX
MRSYGAGNPLVQTVAEAERLAVRYGKNKKRRIMRRSKRSKKGGNTMMILLGVGAAAAIYLVWSKQASAAALQASIVATQTGASTAAQYSATKTQIVAAMQQDGASTASLDPDIATQAYLRGNATELSGIVNAMRGIGATNTAAIFADRLDQVNAQVAVSGW